MHLCHCDLRNGFDVVGSGGADSGGRGAQISNFFAKKPR
jgi:hypothetical protein